MNTLEGNNPIVSEFKEHLFADSKSPATIESYVGDVKGFVTFLTTKGVTFTGDLSRFQDRVGKGLRRNLPGVSFSS